MIRTPRMVATLLVASSALAGYAGTAQADDLQKSYTEVSFRKVTQDMWLDSLNICPRPRLS